MNMQQFNIFKICCVFQTIIVKPVLHLIWTFINGEEAENTRILQQIFAHAIQYTNINQLNITAAQLMQNKTSKS